MVIDEAHSCKKVFTRVKGEIVKDIETSPETLKELEAFFAV